MPLAATKSTDMTDSRCAYGLFSLQGVRRVPLPLKAIDARFEVAGDCAQVSLEQLFEFEGPNAVDVIYVFPLPADASVHHCEMRVGGRKVVAVAKPLAQARAEAAAAHAEGHRTALVEAVRDNLFELNLGNVQPGDAITIRISYLNPVLGDGPGRRLRIPTCPGVRYIPGLPVGADGGTDLVPDAGRLNPPRIGGSDPDAAAFFCAGTLAGVREIHSPTHAIEILISTADGRVPIMLGDDNTLPDHDFILDWQAADDTLALMSGGDPDYLLCSVRVPLDLTRERGPRDVFLLLDASGSMSGANWHALVEAVKLALAELSDSDRVAVTLFSNHSKPLTAGLLPVNRDTVRDIQAKLSRHHPDGGTEFTNAFSETIGQARAASRPVIIVITDGQFGDEARACATAAKAGVEVHTIGIDANVNEGALRKIARRTRGTCTLCDPNEQLGSSIRELVANLLAPGIDRVTATGGWTLVGNPPALRAGQAGLIPFRRSDAGAAAKPPTKIVLDLRLSDGSQREVELPVRTVTGRSPALFAAKAEVAALMDAEQSAAAVALACGYNLLCEGVAFVAIDEARRVPVATVEIEQPSLEPDAGRHMLFGAVVTDMCCSDEKQFLMRPAPSLPRMKHTRLLDMSLPFAGVRPGSSNKRRASPVPSDQEEVARCRELAAKIDCFSGDETWQRLLEDVLLPWAHENRRHAAILRRCLDGLQDLPDTAAAASLLSFELLPYLPQGPADAVMEFLHRLGAI